MKYIRSQGYYPASYTKAYFFSKSYGTEIYSGEPRSFERGRAPQNGGRAPITAKEFSQLKFY
jgi:hypothetical protein